MLPVVPVGARPACWRVGSAPSEAVEAGTCVPLRMEFFEAGNRLRKRMEIDPQTVRAEGSARLPGSVLMSDLRGFTRLSDELGPEQMVALLNRYFERMTDVILRHGGNLSELLGDGMVVLFGAPTVRDDDPLRAVACAIAMQNELLKDALGKKP